jgi:hypothetical protein
MLGSARSTARRITQMSGTLSEVALVAGSPRSGTTWLAETINHDLSYRYCFEPLELHHRHETFRGFHRLQYCRPAGARPEIETTMSRLLEGQVFTPYSDRFDPRSLASRSDRLLIKCTRMNLTLGWIANQKPEVGLILILRHPLSVLGSRERLSWLDWGAGPEDIFDLLAQSDLVADHLNPFVDLIFSRRSQFERQIIMWCVEQMIPRTQMSSKQLHVIRYEDMLANPEPSLRQVFEALGKPWDPSVLERSTMPSKTAWNGNGFAQDPRQHSDRWKTQFSPEQRSTAAWLMEQFGLLDLYPDTA